MWLKNPISFQMNSTDKFFTMIKCASKCDVVNF